MTTDTIVRGLIWLSLACFVTAHLAFQRTGSGAPARGPLLLYGIGAGLALAHYLAAFHWHYDWSHAGAVLSTADQTAEVFGVAWGGGVWVNYGFLATWVLEVVWRARRGEIRHPVGRWGLRVFYGIVIVNGAVTFAAWPMTLVGGVLVAGLVWSWRPQAQHADR